MTKESPFWKLFFCTLITISGLFHRRLSALGGGGSCPGDVLRTRTVAEVSALLRRTTDTAQVIRRVDQTDVGECLREVPQLAPEAGMVFLGKEPEVVAQG